MNWGEPQTVRTGLEPDSEGHGAEPDQEQRILLLGEPQVAVRDELNRP
jgi:hypothetical protein